MRRRKIERGWERRRERYAGKEEGREREMWKGKEKCLGGSMGFFFI